MQTLPGPLAPSATRAGPLTYENLPGACWIADFTQQATSWDKAPSFLHIKDDRLTRADSLTNLAIHDSPTRAFITSAASLGYFQYYGTHGEARLVHRSRIPNLWEPVRTGEIAVSKAGIYYTLNHKLPKQEVKRLLVVFSGVAARPRSASLWRYFEKNYRHIDSTIPGDTAVLRIADIGGIVGSFYANTADHEGAARSIRALIQDVATDLHVGTPRICLLGSSKGATGAVHHGISMDLPFVAVEPILQDEYYETELNDIHFTDPRIFIERKTTLFQSLADQRSAGAPTGILLASPASPQYEIIRDYQAKVESVSLMTVTDSRIRDHPDVPRTVLGPTVTLVNSILLGWPLPESYTNI